MILLKINSHVNYTNAGNAYNKLRVEGVTVDEGPCIDLIKSVKDGYNFLILKELE